MRHFAKKCVISGDFCVTLDSGVLRHFGRCASLRATEVTHCYPFEGKGVFRKMRHMALLFIESIILLKRGKRIKNSGNREFSLNVTQTNG